MAKGVERIDINLLSDESYQCVLDALMDHLVGCIEEIDSESIKRLSACSIVKYIEVMEEIRNTKEKANVGK